MPLRYCCSTFDLFVSVIEFDLLFFRNNHVRNSNRNTGFGRFAETQLLEFYQASRPFLLPRDLVAAPDNVAQLLLARARLKKPMSFGQI